MKNSLAKTLILSATLMIPMALGLGCSHEISRTETDKSNSNGSQTEEKTVVTQNPDGTTSTSHEKQVTNP